MKSNIFFASKWISKETKVKQQTGIIAFVLHKQLQQFSFQRFFCSLDVTGHFAIIFRKILKNANKYDFRNC